MWLFTKHGFFSAVQNWDDKDKIHVRARFKGDLERLCEAYNVQANVVQIPRTDYPYRMDFPRDTWAQIVKDEANGIDYTNFKSAVHDGTDRDDAYMVVWSTLRKAQN
ncbi:MAG: hypothetical protein Q4G03_11885 [Planctomycetia bacterium]|nr:hypothetical protein [Planctomycetia bacterium]